MSEVIGVKHDGGKPWAGTVLAGFWPQLREYFHDQAQGDGEDLVDDLDGWCDALDVFFDVSIAIPDRIVKSAKYLTDHVSAAAYLPHVIAVGTYGARKYDRDNWLHVEGGVERYYEAVGRHVRDVMLGDWCDEESGCVNLGHIAWGILAGAELVRRSAAVAGLAHAIDTANRPTLKLPIEEGKTYIVTYADGKADAGTASFECVSSKGVPLFEIAGWIVRGLDGSVPGTTHRVEGPVEP
jgi:hypothetical protein